MSLELQFTIDKAESDLTGTLAIVTSKSITLDQARLALQHKELLQLLHSQESTYQTKKRKFVGANTPLSIFHVSSLAITRALKLLAATHAFYFKHKLLVCDFYGSTEFYYAIEACDKNQPIITGWLKENDAKLPLDEVEFICSGSHHYYIHGFRLKQIITEVAWKDLKLLYLSPEKVNLTQLQRDYSEQDSLLQPKLVYSQKAEQALPSSSGPLPLFLLSDRLGAFANLWMSYALDNEEQNLKVSFHDPSPWVKDDKGKPRIKRQFDVEKEWERDLLETDYIRKLSGNTHYYCPVDAVAKSLTFLLEIGWTVEDCYSRRICRLTDNDLHIYSAADSFIVKGRVKYGEHQVDLKDVVGAFNRRDRFIQIGQNQVGLLPTGFDSAFGLSSLTEEGEIVQEGIKLQRSRLGALKELFDSSAKFDL